MLEFFGISIAAFRIAGGLYLATSGLGMLRSKSDGDSSQTFSLSEVIPIAVVPIAIPLTSGPGVISAIILFAQEAHGLPGLLKIGAAIGTVSAINYLSFYFSPVIIRVLGHTGMGLGDESGRIGAESGALGFAGRGVFFEKTPPYAFRHRALVADDHPGQIVLAAAVDGHGRAVRRGFHGIGHQVGQHEPSKE